MVDPVANPSANPPPAPQAPDTPAEEATRGQTQVEDGNAEQLEQAKQAAKMEMAQQQAQAGRDKPHAFAAEMVALMETVVQEGVEGYRTPQTDQGAGAHTQDHGNQSFSPKEQAILREFLRELNHLVQEQGTDFQGALRQLKTQQGGKFWQRLTQVLTGKNLPQGLNPLLSGKAEAPVQGEARGIGKGLGEGALPEGVLKPGTQAMLEMIRAETNPRAHVDAMITALALLKQEGMDRSYRELVQHLRLRWGMSRDEMEHFLKKYPVIYFQGPMGRQSKETRNVPIYPLIALMSIPIAKFLGMSWMGAAAAGIVLTLLLFLVSRLGRS